MKKIKAWHFIDGTKLRDGQEAVAGQSYHVDPPLVMYNRGLHASKKAIDALNYAPGLTICRVELSGEITEGDDKLVATDRKILWMADAEKTVKEFAVWCAKRVVHLDTTGTAQTAIDAAEKAIANPTQENRDAAWAAGAAGDAAGAAGAGWTAWAAAWDARDAVWDAARAARDARAAAGTDARDAEKDEQEKELVKRLNELHNKRDKSSRGIHPTKTRRRYAED